MGALYFNRFRPKKKAKQRARMSGPARYGWTDAQLLAALDLADEGMSRAEIARLLTMAHDRPFTRMSVTGALDRIRKETDHIPCYCEKPENKDGGMPAGWWRK